MTEESKKVRKKKINDLLEKVKVLFIVSSILIGIIVLIILFSYRIENPQLTETELMIYSFRKYWWAWLLILISGFINKNDK